MYKEISSFIIAIIIIAMVVDSSCDVIPCMHYAKLYLKA